MTAAPVDVAVAPPVPAPGTTSGAAPGAEGTAVDPLLFALLVDQALAAGQQVDADPGATDPDEDAVAEEQGPAEDAGQVPTWAGLAAVVAMVSAATRDSVAGTEAGPGPEPAPTSANASTAATTSPLPASAPTAPPSAPVTALLTAVPTPQETTPQQAAAAATPSSASAATEDAATALRAADPGTVPVLTGGPATVTPGGAPGQVSEPQTARSVVTQVIPEITRLVSDGEGVHRVTLQLNPKALGEVRVVLTMRQGDVHVRIAGGEEARHALAASSAELTRALQHAGIDEHRLTLTDLTPATSTRGAGPDNPDQQRHHHAPGGNHPDPHGQNSHSWMGDARSATDGSSTSSPTDRARGSARVHEASHIRAAGGVDLRM